MLRDLLYEESVANNREKTEEKFYVLFLVLAITCFAAGGIVGFFAASFIPGIATNDEIPMSGKAFSIGFLIIFVVILLGCGLAFWFIRKKFNLSYDYTFVEDELRVTKVFNGRSRKHFVTIHSDSILKIGWVEKPSYRNVLGGLQGKPIFLTPNKSPADEKSFIYVLVSGSLGKTLYVLECRQVLMEYLVQSAGINKLERQ